jgi:CRP/FNR family cyclic AMP-dependent transcriptional regulator
VAPGNPDPATLSGISLFREMPTRELERLAPLLHERNFPAGASVLTAEQPAEAIYIIIEGSVKIHLLTPEGTEVILAVLGPGEIVGEMSLADSLGRSANVTTLEESAFLWMDRRTFRSGVESSTVLGRNLADVLSRRLRLANAHLLSLATLDVPGRVASQLLALAHEYGEALPEGGARIPIRLIQADLAALVGASRARVNQALGFLRKRSAISVDKDGHITVLEPEVLSRRAR